jgi:hypothetical protein
VAECLAAALCATVRSVADSDNRRRPDARAVMTENTTNATPAAAVTAMILRRPWRATNRAVTGLERGLEPDPGTWCRSSSGP